MRKWLVVAAVSGMALAAGFSPARTPAVGTPSAAANHCYKGYVHANLPWGVRCLRAGERCKKVRNPEYHKYNFQCVNGKLRLQKAPKPKPKGK
jgi:hypothetical protein